MDRFKGILTSINWTEVEKLDKGWSRDEKYYIEDIEGVEE